MRGKLLHAFVLATATLIGAFALFGRPHEAEATRNDSPSASRARSATPVTEELSLPAPAATNTEAPVKPTSAIAERKPWRTVTVRSGDTLSSLFDRMGLPASAWVAILHSGDAAERLHQLRPGHILRVWVDGANEREVSALEYVINRTASLRISRDANGYHTAVHERTVEHRVNYTRGVIENSLFKAGQQAGLSDGLIMQLAGIFGWDVDFALDIRSGDSFTVVYREDYLDGEKLRDGDILSAEFINHGRTFKAVRYTDPKGHTSYYSPDGRSMRKAFLRSPVDFRRISSRFTRSRCHPILGVCRPHRGVDYAAAIGTPIKAAGDGKIVFRGWKGGYGRAIIIRHGTKYSTLYGHMSRFKGGLHSGSRVKQGQIIGYVGQSGLATGPHLHYEFRVNGVHRNPLTVKLPQAAPIPAAYKQDFQTKTHALLAQLDAVKRTAVALETP